MTKQLEWSRADPQDRAGAIDIDAASRTYRSALNAYFRRRISNVHEIDDLTQDVLFRLSRRGADTDIRQIEPYVFQIASGVLANYLRRHVRRERATTGLCDYPDLADDCPSPERIAVGRDTLRRVEQAIADLPERVRHAFLLYRYHDMKQADIAQKMGISVSMVEKHVRTGMFRLMTRMRDME